MLTLTIKLIPESGGSHVQQSDSSDHDVACRSVWSVDADVCASLAISLATLQALTALSLTGRPTAEATVDDEIARIAGLDQAAARRVIDMLQDMRDRVQRAIDQTWLQRDLELAILKAATALPDIEARESSEPLCKAS